MEEEKSYDWNTVFKYSLLLYPITILLAIILGNVVGIDSGWAMPAMSSHATRYGSFAVSSYLILIPVYFAWVYVPIFVFQVAFVFYKVISAFKNMFLNK